MGHWEEADAVLADILSLAPPAVEDVSSRHPARGPTEANMARFFAALHAERARLLDLSGQAERAASHRARALELSAGAGAFSPG